MNDIQRAVGTKPSGIEINYAESNLNVIDITSNSAIDIKFWLSE